MKKAFVRLLEVTLAFIVLFMFLNNIRIYSPPRYADVENVQRLFRIADDAAISLCNNENFRHDFVEGLMPDNLTRRIDAWDKGESSKQYDSTDNTNMTIRQITKFNESNNKIRICLETAGTAVSSTVSICERDSGANCVIGTISSTHEVTAPGSGWYCSEWFNYSVNMSKTYLVNVYFPDSDYYYYFNALRNGFYWKLNVNDTGSETVTGYNDETTTAVFSLRVEAFHDYGFNETMPSDVDYHVWLYSNSSDDGKLDDLINESGNITNNTIITSSCLIYGYNNTYSPKKIVVGVWNSW